MKTALTIPIWQGLDPIEQLNLWLAVPVDQEQLFIEAAHPVAATVLKTIPQLALNGDTAGDRVIIKQALRALRGLTDFEVLNRLEDDFEILSRLIENVKWSKTAAYNWTQGLEPPIFEQWPAAQMYSPRGRVRPGTKARWENAGGKIYGGRMIALKTDLVWSKFSEFGRPHPPYDNHAHHLDTRDIEREEAERLGLFKRLPPTSSRPSTHDARVTPPANQVPLDRDLYRPIEDPPHRTGMIYACIFVGLCLVGVFLALRG